MPIKPWPKRLDHYIFNRNPPDFSYDENRNKLIFTGKLPKDPTKTLHRLIEKIVVQSKSDPYIEIYYDMAGEIAWYAKLGNRIQSFDTYDEMIASFHEQNKPLSVYPDEYIEQEYESVGNTNVLLRYWIKSKKRLNGLVARFRSAINDPSCDNLHSVCNSVFAGEYFKSGKSLLGHLRFFHIDGNYLYVGLDLPNPSEQYGLYEDLYILLMPEHHSDRLLMRARYSPTREYHLFQLEDEPAYNARKRRDKNAWEPIDKFKIKVD